MVDSQKKIPVEKIRPFIYRERYSLIEFLNDSEINQILLDLIRDNKLKYNTACVPELDILNEAYYQCTLINHLICFDFDSRVEEISIKLNTGVETEMCLGVIYTLLSLTSRSNSNGENMISMIGEYLIANQDYIEILSDCRQVIRDCRNRKIKFEVSLEPEYFHTEEIHYWLKLSNCFDIDITVKALKDIKDANDKMVVLNNVIRAADCILQQMKSDKLSHVIKKNIKVLQQIAKGLFGIIHPIPRMQNKDNIPTESTDINQYMEKFLGKSSPLTLNANNIIINSNISGTTFDTSK